MNFFAPLLLRLMFGLGLAWHGFQTLFLSEDGVSGLVKLIEGHNWPMPNALAYIAKLSELLCGLMVALGLFTRWAALVCAFTMGVAIYMTGKPLDFHSWELASLYLTAFAALTFAGPGCVSLDHLRTRRNVVDEEEEELDLAEPLEEQEPVGRNAVDSLDRQAPPTSRPAPAAHPATSPVPPVPPATPASGSRAPGRGRSAK
jgi:putative oxidoreductase